jgi:protocatechuate 3,4-dioxygenase beta subunit
MFANHSTRLRRNPNWSIAIRSATCAWALWVAMVPPTWAAEEVAKEPAAAAPQRLLIRTDNKATGEPISGVAINTRYYVVNGKTVMGLKISDKKGEVVLEFPKDVTLRGVRLEAKAQGMVPYSFDRSSRNQALELPEEYSMPFEKAVTIGGVVRDADGNPVKNAEVDITHPATDADMQNFYFHLARNLKTDAQGRWKCNTAPEDLSTVHLRIQHPDYVSPHVQMELHAAALRDQSHELTLASGPEVSGLVVDQDGKPIKGAHVLVGTSTYDSNRREADTDEQGNFVVKSCNPGQQFLCVTAEGYAPEMQAFAVADENPAVEIQLGPPATFRLRILDQEGNPVVGAEPVPEYWRGQQLLRLRTKVDGDGRWEWKSAPPDEVKFSILAGEKHLTMRNYSLVANDEEQVVRVHPKFRVVGNVTDAATGKAVKEFQVFSAFQVAPQKQWDKYYSAKFKNGEYQYNFDELKPGFALRVEADGYQPAESPTFTVEDYPEGIDFQLHKEVETK